MTRPEVMACWIEYAQVMRTPASRARWWFAVPYRRRDWGYARRA